LRVVEYINALQPEFVRALGGSWGKRLAIDLAAVCRSHGEDFSFAMQLNQPDQGKYFSGHKANLTFICSMLRLADILHFSYDRAPLSLFAEKRIFDETARRHWKAKQEGVNYGVHRNPRDNNAITVEFNAFCDDPETYYFLRDYIRGIEGEIQNYYKFQRENQQAQYSLNIKYDVDYSGLSYDRDEFIPNDNLHFTLDQRRILELLMGVNLYIAVSVTTLFNLKEAWNRNRRYAERLKQECFFYQTRSENYLDIPDDEVDRVFIRQMENLLLEENKSWAESNKKNNPQG